MIRSESEPQHFTVLEFFAQRGFRLRSQKEGVFHFWAPTLFDAPPLPGSELEAVVGPKSLAIQMKTTGNYVPGGDYERRRMTLKFQLMPEEFSFYLLNEEWSPDEYLNVERGFDTEFKIFGPLESIHDFNYDEKTHHLVIQARREIKGTAESEPLGPRAQYLKRKGQEVIKKSEFYIAMSEHRLFDCGYFQVEFQVNEEKSDSPLPSLLTRILASSKI